MSRSVLVAFASLALLSACGSPEDSGPVADTFDGGVRVAIGNPAATSLRQQVEANWRIPGGNACHETIVLRATVAPDGSVRRITPVGGVPAEAGCRKVGESAQQALRWSSPLNFPPDNQPPSVDFAFRLPDWVD
jgi:hypothetical protein